MRTFDATETKKMRVTPRRLLQMTETGELPGLFSNVRFVPPKPGHPGFGMFYVEVKDGVWSVIDDSGLDRG